MSTKNNLLLIDTVVFSLVLVLHLARLVNNWDLILGPYVIPSWVSGIAVVLLFLLAYENWKLMKK